MPPSLKRFLKTGINRDHTVDYMPTLKGSAFGTYIDTIPCTETARLPSSSILLVQPYPSETTCSPFDGRRTHGGLSLSGLRKDIRLRQPSVFTSQTEVFQHRRLD